MDTSLEIEEKLLEAGNKLLKPPPSVEELLPLLDEAVSFLTKVEQSPAKSVLAALSPLIKALVEDVLLRHSDVDVKVALASCLSEITRITAPDAPYDDDKMKAVFELIVSSFENLCDESSRSFVKRAMVLETVCKVRLCVVMLDLECDELIYRMFQYFLKTIREYHPNNIFSSMKSIMTVVLEESEDISMDLVTYLLASVKNENEEIKPIGKRLAESVFMHCADKLKPYVRHAVKSRSLSLNEYSEVVTSVMKGTPVAIECNNDVDPSCAESKLACSGGTAQLTQMAEDTKKEACSKDDNQVVNTSPKSAMGSNVNGGNSTDTQSLANMEDNAPMEQPDISSLTPKSASDDSQLKNSVKSELEISEQVSKEQGSKSNSQVKLEDSSYQEPPVDSEKVDETLLSSQMCKRDVPGSPAENSTGDKKDNDEGIASFPVDDATVEAAKLLDENETSAGHSLPKTPEDEAENVTSLDPNHSLPDEINKETIQEKDDNLVQEDSSLPEVASKKPSGPSDSDLQPKDLGSRVQKETSHKEEADAMRCAEVKGLNQRGEKAKANDKTFVSLEKKDKQTIQQKEVAYSMTNAEVKGQEQRVEKARANDKKEFCSDKHTFQPKEAGTTEILSRKPSEGSDSELQPQYPVTRLQTEATREEEASSMSDAEVKGLKLQGEKSKANNKKIVSSKKKDKRIIQPKEDDSLVEKDSVPAQIASQKPSEKTSNLKSLPQEPGTRVQKETSQKEETDSMSDTDVEGLKHQVEKVKRNKKKLVSSTKKDKRTLQPKEDDSLAQEESMLAEITSKKASEVTSGSESQPKSKANKKIVSSKKKEKQSTQPKEDDNLVQKESVSAEIASKKLSGRTNDLESQPQDHSTDMQIETSHEEESSSMSDVEVKGSKRTGAKAKANKRIGAPSKKQGNQENENDSLVQDESVSADIPSPKPSEGTSDSESEPQNLGTRTQRESSHEEEAVSMSDSELKGLKRRGVRTKAIKTTDVSSKKNNKSRRRRRGKASIEIDAPKSSAKDDTDKVVFFEESPLKSAEHNVKEGSQRNSTKRKRSSGKEKVQGSTKITYGESLVGSRVQVWWPLDSEYYEGQIDSFDRVNKKHKVVYNDGEIEDLDLKKEKWHLVKENLTEKKDLDEPSSPEVSAEIERQKKKKSRGLAETSSSKHDKFHVSPKSVPKFKGSSTKSGHKTKDDTNVKPKSKDRPSKSVGSSKSREVSGYKYDSDEGSGKLKDVISSPLRSKSSKSDATPKTTTKPQQDTTSTIKATPTSKGKANGTTGKSKSTSKGKDNEEVKEKMPTEIMGKTQSKEQETESKSGKKRGASKEEDIESKSGKRGGASKEEDNESKSGKKGNASKEEAVKSKSGKKRRRK
ncbi:unnamed protein product [Cuscuta europaea]|uniref:Uncharacterized protein n=1 Tax=Cuscuta europaea TaxID=41803 RepID=A0A9P0Z4P6_CUSEU|nr:unnamed protein product [Cuscuta europaea]